MLSFHFASVARAFVVMFAILSVYNLPLRAEIAPLIVRNDLGGPLETRVREIEKLRLTGRSVKIKGDCESSCSLYLGLPQTCVYPKAVLGFHGPSSSIYGLALPPAEFEYWSQIMAAHYPPALRQWFLTRARNVTVGVYRISGAEAIRLGARACG